MPVHKRITGFRDATWRDTSAKFCRVQELPNGFRVGPQKSNKRKVRDNALVKRKSINSTIQRVEDEETVADLLTVLDSLLTRAYRGATLRLFDPKNVAVPGHTKLKTIRAAPGKPTKGEREAQRACEAQLEQAAGFLQRLIAIHEDECEDVDDYARALLFAAAAQYGKSLIKSLAKAL